MTVTVRIKTRGFNQIFLPEIAQLREYQLMGVKYSYLIKRIEVVAPDDVRRNFYFMPYIKGEGIVDGIVLNELSIKSNLTRLQGLDWPRCFFIRKTRGYISSNENDGFLIAIHYDIKHSFFSDN